MATPELPHDPPPEAPSGQDTIPEPPAPSTAPEPADTTASQDQQTPASPPLPQRHTAVSPGPRAARFQELYAQSLRRTLGKAGWDNFSGCYPTISGNAEAVLRQVQKQMVDKLAEKGAKEFENIMTSRQVVARLNELESLIADATNRRATSDADTPPTPPHLLPPTRVLAAHTTPALTAHRAQLTARLQATQSQNALLHAEVERQREEMSALLAGLEGIAGDVQAANGVLSQVVGELSAEAREGDEALRAVAAKSPVA